MLELQLPSHYEEVFKLFPRLNVVGLSDLDKVREKFYKEFEDLDRRRGVLFKAKIKERTINTRMEFLHKLELQGDEVPFDRNFNYFQVKEPSPSISLPDYPGLTVENSSNPKSLDSEAVNDTEEIFDDLDTNFEVPEQENIPRWTSHHEDDNNLYLEDVKIGIDVSSEETPDAFSDYLSEVISEPETSTNVPGVVVNPKPVTASVYEVPATLVEFLKEHPRCTVEEAQQYFSKKEIKRQVNLGIVTIRSGRLTV